MAALASPVLVALFTLVLTIIGWKYRQTWERNLKLEEQLRTDRVEIYKRVIEPFLIAFASDEAWKAENKKMGKNEALNSMITSMDYRKTSFFLTLIGSDGVVNAHKNLFQYIYKSEGNVDPSNMLSLLGNFLLEIRRVWVTNLLQLINWECWNGLLQTLIRSKSRRIRRTINGSPRRGCRNAAQACCEAWSAGEASWNPPCLSPVPSLRPC